MKKVLLFLVFTNFSSAGVSGVSVALAVSVLDVGSDELVDGLEFVVLGVTTVILGFGVGVVEPPKSQQIVIVQVPENE